MKVKFVFDSGKIAAVPSRLFLVPLRIFALAALVAAPAVGALAEVTLTHVHGLAYGADGKRIYIPSHHGLAVYENGKWSKAPGPEHDYMGFSATRDRFYSSGHPSPGTGLVNPFGLIRSDDGGKTWKKLGLEGESDFHVLATGYGNNAVYVINSAPNSRMREVGIYATLNDGFSWRKAGGQGLAGTPSNLAVHPDDASMLAVGTQSGLYLSADAGESFRLLAPGQVLAVLFDLDGKTLWYSVYAGIPALRRIDWKTSEKRTVTLPPLTRDGVAYIAQNPANRGEYAIATFERSVFVTPDGGRSWAQITRQER